MNIVNKSIVAFTLSLPFITIPPVTQGAPAAKRVATRKLAKITRADINALLLSLDKAANRKDVDALCMPLSRNCRVTLTIQGSKMGPMNRSQYRNYIQMGFRMAKNYRYARSNTKINIARDGKTARATATTKESMILNGQQMHGTSRETATFAIQGGRLVITSLVGLSTLQ